MNVKSLLARTLSIVTLPLARVVGRSIDFSTPTVTSVAEACTRPICFAETSTEAFSTGSATTSFFETER